jgi:hypothetical protein
MSQNLPALPDYPIDEQYVSQLPRINYQNYGVDRKLGEAVTALVVDEIQRRTEQEDNLAFMCFNYYSYSGFENNEFDELLEAVFDYLLAYSDVNNVDPYELLPDLVVDAVTAKCAQLAQTCGFDRYFPAYRQMVSEGMRLANEIINFMRSVSAPAPAHQRGPQQRTAQRSAYNGPVQQGRQAQQQRPVVRSGVGNQIRSDVQQHTSINRAYTAPTTHVTRPGIGAVGQGNVTRPEREVAQRPATNSRTFVPTGTGALKTSSYARPGNAVQAQSAQRPAAIRSMASADAFSNAVRKHLNYDTPEVYNVPLAVLPDHTILYREQDGTSQLEYYGVPTNQLEGVPGVDYLKLETDPRALARATQSQTKTKLADLPAEAPAVPTADTKETFVKTLAPIVLPETIQANTLSQAIADAQSILFSTFDIEPNENRILEFKVDMINEHLYCSVEDADHIRSLSRKQEFHTLRDLLKTVRSEVDESVYWAIEDRITMMFNNTIESSLGLKVKIDSFSQDFDELIPYLGKKYPNISETAVQKFLATALFAMTRSLTDKTPKDPTKYDGILRLSVPMYVALLPVPAGNLNIALIERFSLLSSETHPELHNILTNLIERTTDAKGATVVSRIVRTIDGIYLEVSQNAFANDQVMIRQYKPRPF